MRFVCLVLALCVTAACGDGNLSPTAPTPTPADSDSGKYSNVAGTYSGAATATSSLDSEQLTGSTVCPCKLDRRITFEITFLGETLQPSGHRDY